jgi:hypothetical protein
MKGVAMYKVLSLDPLVPFLATFDDGNAKHVMRVLIDPNKRKVYAVKGMGEPDDALAAAILEAYDKMIGS